MSAPVYTLGSIAGKYVSPQDLIDEYENPFLVPIDQKANNTANDLRIGFLQMYICYAPSHLNEIPRLVVKFQHQAKQALTEKQKVFGQLPLPGEALTVIRKCIRTRLFVFYAYYCPEKQSQVDALLTKYRGHEAELEEALLNKYGPHPHPWKLFEDWEAREALERQREIQASAEKGGRRFRRAASISNLDGNGSIVFSTETIEGKPALWRNDREQEVRDLGKSPTASLDSRNPSFALFSPASFAYPEPVLRRAQSIVLGQDDVFAPTGTYNSSFGPMVASPLSNASPSSPSPPRGATALAPEDVDVVLKCLNLNAAELCPVGGRSDQALPPLPTELLSPSGRQEPENSQPKDVDFASSFVSNGSFSFSGSPSRRARRNTLVSFVGEGTPLPANSASPHFRGDTPPSALLNSPDSSQRQSPPTIAAAAGGLRPPSLLAAKVSLPPAVARSLLPPAANTVVVPPSVPVVLTKVATEDFAKL